MANLVQGEWGGMPAEQGSVIAAERKRRLAEALKRESTTPQGQMVGRVYVAPSITQYLASGLKGYQANKMQREADTAEENVYKERATKVQAANQALAEALKPKQVQDGETVSMPAYSPEQMDQFGSPRQDAQRQEVRTPTYKTVNPTPEDMLMAQLQYAQQVGDPRMVSQALGSQINYQGQQQTRADEREFRTQESEANRQQRMLELQLRMEDSRLSRQEQAEARRELAQMNNAARMDMAQLTASMRQPEAPVAIMGPDGQAVLVPRSQAIGQRPYTAAQEAKDAEKAKANTSASLSAQQAIDQAKILFDHPGRVAGTGASSFMSKVPGTDAKGFQANLDTFKAQTFVPMVSALKGMGALSDAEGKKLSEAVGALDPSMPEAEFEKNLQSVAKTLYDKAKASGLNVSMPDFSKPTKGGKSKVQDEADRILNGNR